ncbi:MAG: prepilin-type N-terminal cleavage/methylation domain-containing protein [Elusimicrobiaceae bacterium]|nr:prepilin-type N-terminal cleavage/methylation domain-containing protein [Elusimicrobiaceae bacterium]
MYNKIKRGFTLTELMAVVIIIALLAILSTGYYKRSVEQARFSEGLMAASAIVEGVNRDYLEQKMNGIDEVSIPAINQLDISLSGAGCTSDSCETQYFTVTVDSDTGVTTATRKNGTYANAYSIQIQPHFAASNRDQIACVGNSEDGQTFCESMGYTACTEGVCVKPN